MKFIIFHLSDMHFRSKNNILLERIEQFTNAIQNLTMGIDHLFMVISGDIAYSGKVEEYNQAMKFIDNVKNKVESYSKKKINFIIIPGNHDCNYKVKNKKVREKLIKSIQQNKYSTIDGDIVDQCCAAQNNIFDFIRRYQDKNKIFHSDKLIWILNYKINKFNIIFNCYNTSWVSQKNEQPGKMFFPVKKLPEKCFKYKADLIISVLHHSFNWQIPRNSRELSTHLEETSDLVLTAHEHEFSKYKKDDHEGNYTEIIEGSVLQEHGDDSKSEFNVIKIDVKNKTLIPLNYKWNGELYAPSSRTYKPLSYERSKRLSKKVFEINSRTENYLNDPGAKFSHPHKTELILDDIFIFPNMRNINIDKIKDIPKEPLSSEALCKINKSGNKILLIGSEKSGKSSLCKILYKHYYENQYVPIYISGDRLKSTSLEDFNNLINQCYEDQYSDETIEQFYQLKNQKKLLIIDDLDRSRLAIKYKSSLLIKVNKYYPNIIITSDDLFMIEMLGSKEKHVEVAFEEYQKFSILEFGHLLRSRLIKKWNLLGSEEDIEEKELTLKEKNTKHVVDSIIGRNFVPSYPFFLLIILQAIELGHPHDLKHSAYGHYYQYLITHNLSLFIKNIDEIETYYNYIAELAYWFFKNKTREISKNSFYDFHKWYCSEYKVSPSFRELINLDTLIKNLSNAFILEQHNLVYKFKYKYIYYFFVARYFSNNISGEDIKKIVIEMCKRLYREEFANIIMFLTYHSKDPNILEEILANATSLFSDYQPVKFEDDILSINNLIEEIPKLVLENVNVEEFREEALKDQDNIELYEKQEIIDSDGELFDVHEEIKLDEVSQFNIAFKTIEILGQILKNYYGSLKGTKKYHIGKETYFLGLRLLSVFFSLLEDLSDFLAYKIKSVIEEKGITDRQKIENISKNFLFGFFLLFSYLFIKKISFSIGNEKLSETFKEIQEKNDITSVHLIDISIKLDFYATLPFNDIEKLGKKLTKNALPFNMLRTMVMDYIYMFPTNYKDRQRICNSLGISMKTQRGIDFKSSQKKRT